MSDVSAVLSMPYIQPSQAQKHVTHNEAIRQLDAVVQLAVAARDLDSPPAAPETGARYIVGPGASGDWAGQADAIAVREVNGWTFTAPQPGWQAWVLAEGLGVVFDATTGWVVASGGADVSADTVGINASADTTNRLTVAAPATLLNNDGAGHQLKINKAADGDTASLLFQSAFDGHAEMGLVGDTDFVIKVSDDGAAFTEAMRIDAASAVPQMPQGAVIDGTITGTAVQSGPYDATNDRLMMVGAFGLGQDSSATTVALDTATTTGFFNFPGSDPDSPGGTGGVVIVARYAGNWINQLVFSPNSTFMWLRWTKDEGTIWSDWAPIFTAANLVGTVSQSGGTPTGAVIEQGSNADGDYVRYADGTQICTQRETLSVSTLPVGAVYRDSGQANWTYSAAFVAPPTVALSCEATICWADAGAVSATDCARVLWSALSTTTSTSVHAQAVGRWF